MPRIANRPLPAGRLQPVEVLTLGDILSAAGPLTRFPYRAGWAATKAIRTRVNALGKSPCMEPSQAATQRGPMLGAPPRASGARYVHAGSAPRRCLNVRPTEVRMRIIINGAGIAGPTLAYWLRKAGHEVVLVEAAPSSALAVTSSTSGWSATTSPKRWA